ncbi:MAG: hypothetical protein R6W91_04570 [Thermoplasmata archaeon]
MKTIISIIIGLAILMAAPLSAMAQISEPEPSPVDPLYPDDPGYDYTDPYWYYWPEQGGFDYTDGVANGTYVNFLLDETTGTISDYTTRMVDYNFYYPMIYNDGMREEAPGFDAGYMPEPTEYVVSFFETIDFKDFVANGHPGVFGQSLIFMGENVMMTFGDYEYSSMYFQFGEENGTVTFAVPDGIEITKMPYYYDLYDIPEDDMIGIDYDYGVEGGSASMPAYDYAYEGYGQLYWSYDQVYLRSGNITCSIWVDRGTIDIAGSMVTVHTYPGAYLSTSSWIEYAWQYQYAEPWFVEEAPSDDRGAINGAIENGLMAAVGYLFMGESGAQYSDSKALNDPSFKLEFQNVEQNRFQVEVQSEIKNGRIVTLNVNKDALDAESAKDLKVLLDDQKIRACGSMEELVDLQGGSKSGYYMVSGNSQSSIFVYVPSFSTHVITVGLADGLGGVVLPMALAVGFMAIVVGLVIHRGKRNRDEL